MLCRRLAARAILIVVAVMAILAALAALTHPAAAQADFPFFGGRRAGPSFPWQWGWGGPPQQAPQPQQREKPVDFTRAPPPKKQDGAPAMNVLVMGDSMADWLAYGLEDAFSETPEIGVVRKHRAYSGLIKGETKAESYEWPQAAREILAGEKVDFVVMMIGLADRQPIRERQIRSAIQQRQAAKPATGQPAAPGQPMVLGPAAADQAAPAAAAPPAPPQPAAPKPVEQQAAKPTTDAEAPPDDQPPALAPEPSPSGTMTYEFRSEKWADFYSKRIDDTIAALKSKGVPVFWVGLPAIRGTRSTSEMVYLNELYRARAEKAGINYVDVWDGFVDEAGNFSVQGPDFEGQIRRLRTGDGVHFTKFGARKLAHYVEREIRRVMLARGAPMATPAPEEPTPMPAPAAVAKPSGPAPRPVAGPVVPLAAPAKDSEGLLGSSAARSSGGGDAVAAKVTIKGETVSGPKGRADDFAWPRQDGLPEMAVGVTEPNVEPMALAPADAAGGASATRPQQPPGAQQAPPRRPAPGTARLGDRPPREPPREPPRPPGFFQGFFGFGR
jgi:hypothetical protein